ncbi:endonuclease/exonuclease/phosphatase family protein [Kytococcus sp. Marseille-QA3725]
MDISSNHPSRRSAIAGMSAAAAASMAVHPASANTGRASHPVIGRSRRGLVHVMSFNIRFDKEGTPPSSPDHWPTRRPAVTQLLRTERPDLLGVQEAEFTQLPALEESLPHHRMIGFGREGGSKGEYSAILYDARRFTLLEWDQFALSDTPDVIGSATWGNSVPRIVTWGRFSDTETGTQLVHVNTHFDHESENARRRSAEVVAALRERFAGVPVLVTGDFNALADESAPYSTLTATYRDTWHVAGERLTPRWGTFPDYEAPVVGEKRIDWVLATPGVRVLEVGINTARPRGVWPSDHTPVQALVRMG